MLITVDSAAPVPAESLLTVLSTLGWKLPTGGPRSNPTGPSDQCPSILAWLATLVRNGSDVPNIRLRLVIDADPPGMISVA